VSSHFSFCTLYTACFSMQGMLTHSIYIHMLTVFNAFVVRTVYAAICFLSTYSCVGYEVLTAVVMKSTVF
jgi:hypothetical protein